MPASQAHVVFEAPIGREHLTGNKADAARNGLLVQFGCIHMLRQFDPQNQPTGWLGDAHLTGKVAHHRIAHARHLVGQTSAQGAQMRIVW